MRDGAAGRTRVAISRSAIGYSDVEDIAATSDGAVVTFAGIVRDASGGRRVTRLDYEVYSEMAEIQMRRIAEEALGRWDLGSVVILHRVGELAVGEISVIIAVAAPHRSEAFDACEFLIDTLKQTVPIWKKEYFEDGTSAWVNHP